MKDDKSITPQMIELKRTAGAYYKKGKHHRAMKNYTQLLELSIENKDLEYQALSHNAIGNIHFLRKETGEAVESYQKAFKIYDKIDKPILKADVENNIGNSYFIEGKYDDSYKHYEKALTVFEENENYSIMGNVLKHMGLIESTRKDYDKSIELFSKAEKVTEKLGDTLFLADIYNNMSNIYLLKSDLEKALDYNDKSSEQFKSANHEVGIALTSVDRGTLLMYKGEIDKVNLEYEAALKIIQKSNMKDLESYIIFSLGTLQYFLKNYDNALSCYNASLNIKVTIADEISLGYDLSYLATLYTDIGNHKEALKTALFHFKNMFKVKNDVRHGRTHLATALALSRISDEDLKDSETGETINSIMELTEINNDPGSFFIKAINTSYDCKLWETYYPAKIEYAKYLYHKGENDEAKSILDEVREYASRNGMQLFVNMAKDAMKDLGIS